MRQRPRWGLARVTGRSMEPTLYAGDRLLVDYRRRPVVGRIVVARFADGTLVVKRVAERREKDGRPAWYLLGDSPDAPGAIDSRARGPVADAGVLGVVRARVWPRPRRLRGPVSDTPHSRLRPGAFTRGVRR